MNRKFLMAKTKNVKYCFVKKLKNFFHEQIKNREMGEGRLGIKGPLIKLARVSQIAEHASD